jgi:hypothetical protein
MSFVFTKACPPGYYGQTCDFPCNGDDDYCKGLLICLPEFIVILVSRLILFLFFSN